MPYPQFCQSFFYSEMQNLLNSHKIAIVKILYRKCFFQCHRKFQILIHRFSNVFSSQICFQIFILVLALKAPIAIHRHLHYFLTWSSTFMIKAMPSYHLHNHYLMHLSFKFETDYKRPWTGQRWCHYNYIHRVLHWNIFYKLKYIRNKECIYMSLCLLLFHFDYLIWERTPRR